MIVALADPDWGRLVPVLLIGGLFAFVGWVVLPRLPKLPSARSGRRYVEVAVGWTTPEVQELAQRLRDEGLVAAADSEPRPHDMGSVVRSESLDGRPFVAVPREQVDEAKRLVGEWRGGGEGHASSEPIKGGVFATWAVVARCGAWVYLVVPPVVFVWLWWRFR